MVNSFGSRGTDSSLIVKLKVIWERHISSLSIEIDLSRLKDTFSEPLKRLFIEHGKRRRYKMTFLALHLCCCLQFSFRSLNDDFRWQWQTLSLLHLNLIAFLNRARDRNLVLNPDKFRHKVSEIRWMGHVLTSEKNTTGRNVISTTPCPTILSGS